jgi:hypothetical protein
VILTGHVSDVGTLDTVAKIEVDWGDGTAPVSTATADPTARVIYDAATRTFTVTHRYLDDTPPGTPRDTLTVKVTATDDDTGASSSTIPIEVVNIAPKVSIHIDDADLFALKSFVLKGTIDDPGVKDGETVRIDWGDGQFDLLVLQPDVRSFAVAHTYLGLYVDRYVISVGVTDKDTGFGTAQLPVKVHTFIPVVSDLPPIFPDNRPGSPYIAPNADAPFHSTVFNSPEILGGGIKIGRLFAEQGSAVQLPLNFAELGGTDLSRIVIDWGDGNKETLNNPGGGSVDVAHAYPHVVGDDEIATGSISSPNGSDGSQNEVVVKAYKKGLDGRDQLASITRYRLEVGGAAPRIDRFTFNRSDASDDQIDTVNGRISYPGLPDAVALQVTWSDGTVSNGTIEFKDGEYWFSAGHNYTGKAPATMIGLRFINTTNSKGIGAYEINPQPAAQLNPTSPQDVVRDRRHGDASSVPALKTSDVALMFGAGFLVKQAAGPASFKLDRLLAKTIRRGRSKRAGFGIDARPVERPCDRDWLATPYRVPPATTAGIDGAGSWQEVDDWLVASNRATVQAAPDAADWLIVRE